MRRALALAALLGAGCYSTSPTACKTTCDPPGHGPCPSGMTCLADGFCHSSADEPACEPVDAGARPPDAPSGLDGASAGTSPPTP